MINQWHRTLLLFSLSFCRAEKPLGETLIPLQECSYFNSSTSVIPLVDFSAMSFGGYLGSSSSVDEEVRTLARRLYGAFSTTGFAYLKNHGVMQQQIDGVLEIMDQFFALDEKLKAQYSKKNLTVPNGWDTVGKERPDPSKHGDLKESFDFWSVEEEDFEYWPSEVPQLKETVKSFYQQMSALALRVLSVMAMGLELESNTFDKFNQHMGSAEGGTDLRFNFYPVIPDVDQLKPGQLRCAAHTDYGAITLLIQDDAGGLEIATVDGTFVSAPPIKGTILVNIADLMQRWTSDRLISTVHRVMIPESEGKRQIPRRSIAMFVHPDRNVEIVPLDGSGKYPPVKAGDYLEELLHKTYKS